MVYTLKPEEVGVFAIGGLGEIETYELNTKTRLSSSMLGLNSQKMTCWASTTLSLITYIVDNIDRVKAALINTDMTTSVDSFQLAQLLSTLGHLPWLLIRGVSKNTASAQRQTLRNQPQTLS